MRVQRPKSAAVHPQWRIPEPLHIQIKLAATAAIAVLPLLLLASLLPRPLLLPALCLVANRRGGRCVVRCMETRCACDSQNVTAWGMLPVPWRSLAVPLQC
jgi:hypothetical protein